MTFKSSNIRRAISSKLRSRKDRSANNASNNNSNSNYNNDGQEEEDDEIFENDNVVIGSIFLACISLLLAPDVTDHERLFAAQTLNHRCRSLKIIEAFDIESEDGIINGIQRLVEAWEMIRNERSNVILHNSSSQAEPPMTRRCEITAAAMTMVLMIEIRIIVPTMSWMNAIYEFEEGRLA